MALIRPRLTDYYEILVAQEDVDFAIPFLDEDLPLCVDPFLLWKSPSLQENALHAALVNSFNYLGYLVNKGEEDKAIELLVTSSECREVGLGFSRTRHGIKIGSSVAKEVLSLFKCIPQIKRNGFIHFEEVQLYVDHISKDRISDISCSFLKSFLIDYTMHNCDKYSIPTSDVVVNHLYDPKKNKFLESELLKLPINPESKEPLLFVPKRWLRIAPWINNEDYMRDYFLKELFEAGKEPPGRAQILNYNRNNYGVVQSYIKIKERTQNDCLIDPLFKPIPVLSAKRKFAFIKSLPTGKGDNADKKYEDTACQLISSLLYPHLDFASEQVRTDSGVSIRDLIFYNTRSINFLSDIHKDYGTRQIVFELKNVHEIERYHINQLNRYLNNEFGNFGIIITRNPIPRSMFKNTIDLWSGQRKCIICIDDIDLSLMVEVFDSKQRFPIEVLNRKYVEFIRACPS